MSVDERRETFHINRVSVSDLDDRLIAQSYRRDVVAAAATLRSKGACPLGTALSGRITQGRTPEYGTDGDTCLKTRNVVGGLVDTTDVDRVSHAFALRNAGKRIARETVLMNRSGAGSIGRVSIYLGETPVFTNEHLLRFCVSSPHDPAFVAIFFGSTLGERVLERGIDGSTGQLNMVQEHVEKVPVLLPDPLAQQYIGNKVRQAEAMVQAVARIRRRISELLSPFHPDAVPNVRTSRVRPALLTDTLNANPYMANFVRAQDIVDHYSSRTIDQLSSSVADGPFGSNLIVTDYQVGPNAVHPVVRVKNCENGCFDRTDLVWINTSKQRELIRSEVLPGDLLVTKAGRIGSAAVYPEDLPTGNITSHLIRARLKPPIDSHYVAEFLETPVGRAVTLRHSFKSTRPELTKAEIETCPIPLLPEEEMAAVAKLARLKNLFFEYSALLITAARLLLEGLLVDRCSAAELADAQRALQGGNLDLDRKLLTRLSKGWLGVPSEARLFPDVDGLYKALDDLKNSERDQRAK